MFSLNQPLSEVTKEQIIKFL